MIYSLELTNVCAFTHILIETNDSLLPYSPHNNASLCAFFFPTNKMRKKEKRCGEKKKQNTNANKKKKTNRKSISQWGMGIWGSTGNKGQGVSMGGV